MPYLEIKDFSFDLLPLDVDLYSLEMKIIRELYIEDNHTIYSTVAESIHRLQCVFGRIHNIFGKGKAAHSIYQILKLKEQEVKLDENFGDIEHLIIFDRSSDFLTPLLRQITYEGLIDEFYGIQGGISKVPASLFEENRNVNKKYDNVRLNSENDYIFEEIRLLTINGARMALKTRGQEFDRFTDAAKELKDVNEKAAAVKRIKNE